jgi:hypothetical protein
MLHQLKKHPNQHQIKLIPCQMNQPKHPKSVQNNNTIVTWPKHGINSKLLQKLTKPNQLNPFPIKLIPIQGNLTTFMPKITHKTRISIIDQKKKN